MDLMTSIKTCFVKYADYKGRALRSEFWWWMLFTTATGLVLSVVNAFVFGSNFEDTGVLDGLFSLATFIPTVFVTTRRLHDVERSGWWQLIAFTIIGILLLLYWLIIEGDKGDNFYGPHPLHDDVDGMTDVFR